jgi:endoglucanase
VTHPIAAGGGRNIVYETHVYDPQQNFDDLFVTPARTLPVLIGEYGPENGMSMDDCGALQRRADELGISHLAWTFHFNCSPNLIQQTARGCGVGMQLVPTDWGVLVRDHLVANAW